VRFNLSTFSISLNEFVGECPQGWIEVDSSKDFDEALLTIAKTLSSQKLRGWVNSNEIVFPLSGDFRFACVKTSQGILSDSYYLIIGCRTSICHNGIIQSLGHIYPEVRGVVTYDKSLYLSKRNPEIKYEIFLDTTSVVVRKIVYNIRQIAKELPLDSTAYIVDTAIKRTRYQLTES
jgi:hypothetical protein